MEIRIARSNEEREAALELSYKYFPISYFEAKEIKTKMRHYLPSDFELMCFIVAIENGKVLAVLRFYPRKMIIAGVEFEALGITDYCVDKTCHKNETLGVKFLIKCSEILRKTKYPLALGSARRVMSNYYFRFGFVGCDSYCKCRIEKLKLPRLSPENIIFTEVFDEGNIDTYELMRRKTFSSEWGLVIRTRDFWRWIGYQATKLKKYRFFEITRGSKLVGYFVISDVNLIDYGLCNEEFQLHSQAMMCFLSEMIGDSLCLNFSPSNRLFQSLGLSNLCYTMRYVPDEGIVALGLNKEKLVEIFCKVTSNVGNISKNRIGKFIIANNLRFISKNEKIHPAFDPKEMKRQDEQVVLNSLFMGTFGAFSLQNYAGPPIIPPTFFRINDLDGM